MKILYVSSSIIPSRNANSVHVMKMCSALKGKGNEVTLIATKGTEINNKEVFDFYDTSNRFSIIYSKPGRIQSVSRLMCVVKEAKAYDVIYTRWGIAAFVAGCILRKRVIMEYHAFPGELINSLALKLNRHNKRILLNVFITRALEKCFKEKKVLRKDSLTCVAADGADLPKNIDLFENDGESLLECCYVGSFLPGKGVDTVVKIANRLSQYEFHVVGGTPEQIEEQKKKSTKGNIVWHGYMSQSEMKSITQKCKIALLPNKTNVIVQGYKDIGEWTSPLKMFEYMAQKKCVVASNIEVLKEVLVDKQNSILVEAEDIDAWAQAIVSLDKDRKYAEYISSNARKDIEEKYSWTKRAEFIMSQCGLEASSK